MKLTHIVLNMENENGQGFCTYEIDENRRVLREITLEGQGWEKVEINKFIIGSVEGHPEITNYCLPFTYTADLVEGYKPVALFENSPRLEAFAIREVKFADDIEEEDDDHQEEE